MNHESYLDNQEINKDDVKQSAMGTKIIAPIYKDDEVVKELEITVGKNASCFLPKDQEFTVKNCLDYVEGKMKETLTEENGEKIDRGNVTISKIESSGVNTPVGINFEILTIDNKINAEIPKA